MFCFFFIMRDSRELSRSVLLYPLANLPCSSTFFHSALDQAGRGRLTWGRKREGREEGRGTDFQGKIGDGGRRNERRERRGGRGGSSVRLSSPAPLAPPFGRPTNTQTPEKCKRRRERKGDIQLN